ncbi:MAG: tRNA pseudouridine(55) synthase TruB [Anaerolineae bacterium]|nr:tRNA pseudouridine(55) synthase TruB [Anaerolineae bacterium]
MDGILNLDKPRGLTSHDVVNRIRRVAGQRRVGHTGTLDPMATGVLVVCLGRATRAAEYVMDSPKTYRARVLLGVTTDTYDAEGDVVATAPVEDVTEARVLAALDRFRGPIQQVPPMYSAIKRDGQPLYKLARAGVTVERDARAVEIGRLEMSNWQPPALTLTVTCSPGTYVRSLAHDLGRALGCGAHLVELVRLASGDFTLDDAVPLDEVTRERLLHLLLPIDAALRRYPAMQLDEAAAAAVRSGRGVAADLPEGAGLARAYGPDGAFLAVMAYRQAGAWHPHKVFA